MRALNNISSVSCSVLKSRPSCRTVPKWRKICLVISQEGEKAVPALPVWIAMKGHKANNLRQICPLLGFKIALNQRWSKKCQRKAKIMAHFCLFCWKTQAMFTTVHKTIILSAHSQVSGVPGWHGCDFHNGLHLCSSFLQKMTTLVPLMSFVEDISDTQQSNALEESWYCILPFCWKSRF